MVAENSRVTDHVKQGLERLISQYRGKPRIEAWLTSYLEEIQELSDQIWLTIVNRLVDHAVGYHLRVLGKIVGQPWAGEGDDRYRLLIRARIAVNYSGGTVADMLNIASLLVGHKADLLELFPASIWMDIGANEFGDSAAGMLHEARGGGVGIGVIWSDGPEDLTFAFADGDDEQDDEVRGLSGDDPDVGPGGLWPGVI